jgi:hypothetical protein
MMPKVLFLAVVVGTAACHREPRWLAVEAGPPLRLVAAPGVRINALLKPALELDDGTVVRFDSPFVTPDSAYFKAAPTATPPASKDRHGRLRLSICREDEQICRLVVMPVTW